MENEMRMPNRVFWTLYIIGVAGGFFIGYGLCGIFQ